jgi:hypothetical protein
MGSRYGNSPPWFLYGLAAVFMVTGLYYFVLGIRAKSRGAYTVHIPAAIGKILGDRRGDVAPRVAIALGLVVMLGAGFFAWFAYASSNPFRFG